MVVVVVVVVVMVEKEEREKRLMCNSRLPAYFALLIGGKRNCVTKASVTHRFFLFKKRLMYYNMFTQRLYNDIIP